MKIFIIILILFLSTISYAKQKAVDSVIINFRIIRPLDVQIKDNEPEIKLGTEIIPNEELENKGITIQKINNEIIIIIE